MQCYHVKLLNALFKGLLGGEKLWAGDVVLAAPLIMRQVTIQVVSVKNMSPEAHSPGIPFFSPSSLLMAHKSKRAAS